MWGFFALERTRFATDHEEVLRTVRPFLVVPADMIATEADRDLVLTSMRIANDAMERHLHARIPFAPTVEALQLPHDNLEIYGLDRLAYFTEIVGEVTRQRPLSLHDIAMIFYVGDHYEWLLGCAIDTTRAAVVHIRNLGQSEREERAGQPPAEQLAESVIHELGHVSSIEHNVLPGRIMSVVNSDFALTRLKLDDLQRMFDSGLAIPLDG